MKGAVIIDNEEKSKLCYFFWLNYKQTFFSIQNKILSIKPNYFTKPDLHQPPGERQQQDPTPNHRLVVAFPLCSSA